MGRPVNREKRRNAAREVVLRAMKDGQTFKNMKSLRDLLAEESYEKDYSDDYFGALTNDDLGDLLCEAWSQMAKSSQTPGSPLPPVPMAPQASDGPGLFHTVGSHTIVGPGNSLTPAPSHQESDVLNDLGQSSIAVEEESVEEPCTDDVPDFEDDVSGPQTSVIIRFISCR
jgi:hypothetical protein